MDRAGEFDMDAPVRQDDARQDSVPQDSPASEDDSALPMRTNGSDDLVTQSRPTDGAESTVLEPSQSLVIADIQPPGLRPSERFIRLAYRLGVSGATLTSPLAKAAKPRLRGTVETPLEGNRAAGMAVRAGHFLVHGVKAPISQIDFSSSIRLTPPFESVVHGFGWLRDLAASAPREQCVSVAERILGLWLAANTKPGKGSAWTPEGGGNRLRNWLVFAPLILSGNDVALRARALEAMATTARWLDRNVTKGTDRLGQAIGWGALVAAGLLLPDGKPRRLYAEAGLARALGELIAEDGGVLSRSPLAQSAAIESLVDLRACYEAVGREPPEFLVNTLHLLVPPLLSLVHGDGALGSWQGAGAIQAERIAALIEASGVRTRPLKDARQWGYQRVAGGKSLLQFDAAPPPLAKHSRWGCASTLAFEFSHSDSRIIVNCGGAAFAGGQVPVRIEQGLRATAAHSTLALDNANSTAVLMGGKLGSGVNEVEIDRRTLELGDGSATRIEASHDGYATRYNLIHRRILIMRDAGGELRGEDLLIPAGKKAKRGKVGFAIRFHIGTGIEIGLAEDGKGAGLALPDGSYWQFRANMGADAGGSEGEVSIEESLWVDGEGRPHPIQQLVIQGMASRGGDSFSWLLKKMG